jgi:hypothetical protein
MSKLGHTPSPFAGPAVRYAAVRGMTKNCLRKNLSSFPDIQSLAEVTRTSCQKFPAAAILFFRTGGNFLTHFGVN